MLQFQKVLSLCQKSKHLCSISSHWLSTITLKDEKTLETTNKQNQIFEEEKRRQIDSIKRIEKIEVHYKGAPEDFTLYLNKDLSTPFNVAQRK